MTQAFEEFMEGQEYVLKAFDSGLSKGSAAVSAWDGSQSPDTTEAAINFFNAGIGALGSVVPWLEIGGKSLPGASEIINALSLSSDAILTGNPISDSSDRTKCPKR